MKRDWEVIRAVLEEIEGLGEQQFQGAQYAYAQDTPPDKVNKVRHLLLLKDAGFVSGINAGALDGPCIMCPELTWQGHELLDLIRSKTVWAKVKKMAKDKGLELSLDVVKRLGKLAIDQMLGEGV